MLKIKDSGQFKKDYKKCVKRGLDMNLLKAIVKTLAIPEPLDIKNKDHNLTGNYAGFRECHIMPDWLLIYRYNEEYLELVRTGTHSDLF
ncbi:MAG: type II toxin-antitoxin system YafQ family toxin [Lachnospira eligens]